jgi:hypothetical protein
MNRLTRILLGGKSFSTILTLKQQISNYSRRRMSDKHWEMIERGKVAADYDRGAYEHELEISGRPKSKLFHNRRGEAQPFSAQPGFIYLVKLEGILDTPEKIHHIAKLSRLPVALHASGDDGDAAFFDRINGRERYAIAK